MNNDVNSYQDPVGQQHTGARALLAPRWRVTKRRFAVFLMVLPVVFAFPVLYWVFNMAGGWFVSTDLEPDRRATFLGLMYISLMMSISAFAWFFSFLLLWRDGFYPMLSGTAAIIFGILLLPAILFIGIGIQSYLQFG